MPPRTNRLSLLRESLDRLHEGYGPSHLESDPLLYVHACANREDREVVGFLAAVFAYGHVPQILRNLERILLPLRPSAADAIRKGSVSGWNQAYPQYAYRFQRREDLTFLLCLLGRVLADFGSVRASFLHFYSPLRSEASPVRRALTEWVAYLRGALRSLPGWKAVENPRGIYHLLPDPATGSPCKRWNLYLRWMVRGPDGLDLGLWRAVSPRHLILPLDTHTARICRYIGLTRRAAPSWAMAEEITRRLRRLDPDDPVRYDFSIARLGILARCTRKIERNRCVSCELSRICHARRDRPAGNRGRGTERKRAPVSRQGGAMVS